MGSPGSPLTGNPSQWAPGAGSENRPFDPREWSVEGKKPSRELKTFDGDLAHYDNWRRRGARPFRGDERELLEDLCTHREGENANQMGHLERYLH